MLKIKVFVREITKEDELLKRKVSFFVANCGGTYLPLADAEDGVSYSVRFTKKGKVQQLPDKEGVYEIGYETSKDIFIDKRPDYVAKHIVRVNASKVVFVENLPAKEPLPF